MIKKIAKNNIEIKRGNIVEIFTDPMSELHLEGRAKLVRYVRGDSFTETWMVKFIRAGEPMVERRIKIHN